MNPSQNTEVLVTVGINECVVSDNPDSVLVTYALGSCIAVMAWDRLLHIGGMIHYSLPQASIHPGQAEVMPAKFGDTGIPFLFRSMYDLGAQKRHLVVKVAGGACLNESVFDTNMDIGRRNYVILRKMFWKNNIMITAEDTGGRRSRTVKFRLRDGRTTVSSKGIETVL